MPENIDPAEKAAQLILQAKNHEGHLPSDYQQRLEMLTAAQVWATLALRLPEKPEVKAAAWTSATPAVRIGELVLRNATASYGISMRFAAKGRMEILLMQHGGLPVSQTFITTETRVARIAGEMLQGKFGDIDTDTLDELSFHLGVLTEAQRLSDLGRNM